MSTLKPAIIAALNEYTNGAGQCMPTLESIIEKHVGPILSAAIARAEKAEGELAKIDDWLMAKHDLKERPSHRHLFLVAPFAWLEQTRAERDSLRALLSDALAVIRFSVPLGTGKPSDDIRELIRRCDATLSEHGAPHPCATLDPNRCAACGWPLKENVADGCVRGNCSQRPHPVRLYDPERFELERAEMMKPDGGATVPLPIIERKPLRNATDP
jgi:hypothetical protein